MDCETCKSHLIILYNKYESKYIYWCSKCGEWKFDKFIEVEK